MSEITKLDIGTFRHGVIKPSGKVHLIDGSGHALCGAGRSSYAHSFRNPRARVVSDPVDCKRCQEFADKHLPEPTFAVRVTHADNPAANAAEHLGLSEVAARWPHLGPLVRDPDFGSLDLSSGPVRVRIARHSPHPGDNGYDAGYSGMAENENPYVKDTPEHGQWERGHAIGVADANRLKEVGLY